MLQYGYANYEYKGYHIASKNAFFNGEKPERIEKLRRLMHHVSGSEEVSISYMGITTDLDLKTEEQRFYFQMSGREPYRSADYAQGFVQDADQKEPYFYGKTFLELLRAEFLEGAELCSIPAGECDDAFPDIPFPEIDKSLKPAKMDEELLTEILEGLMTHRRLILKLDRSGKGTARYTREILLGIYTCLPYGFRRAAGFCTCVTPARLDAENPEERLPLAVRLCLVDKDTFLPPALPGYMILDMNQPLKIRKKTPETIRFLKFLIQDKGKEDFFEMMYQICEKMSYNSQIPMDTYQDAFHLREITEQELSDETLMHWCSWFMRNRTRPENKQMKEIFLYRINKKIGYTDMQRCFMSSEFLEELPPFLEFGTFEKFHGNELRTSKTDEIILLFDEILKKKQPDSQLEVQKLGKILSDYYYEQILQELNQDMLHWGNEIIPTQLVIERLEEIKGQLEKKAARRGSICIMEYAGSDLLLRIDELWKQRKERYQSRRKLEREQLFEKISALREKQITFGVLTELYDEAINKETYPLLGRTANISGFGTAFGNECEELLKEMFHNRKLPMGYEDCKGFLKDWENAENNKNFIENLPDDADIKRYKAAAASVEWYLSQLESDSFSGMLFLLAQLWNGNGKMAVLGNSFVESEKSRLRERLRKNYTTEDEVLEDLHLCSVLVKEEKELISQLCESLWRVDSEEIIRCRKIQRSNYEWSKIGTELGKRIAVYSNGRCIEELPAGEACELLTWMLDKQSKNVTAAVRKCIINHPLWMIAECGNNIDIFLAVMKTLGTDIIPVYEQVLLSPVQEVGLLHSLIIKGLREHGKEENELLYKAEPSWRPLICAEYRNSLLEEMNDTIAQIQRMFHRMELEIRGCRAADEKQRKAMEERNRRNEIYCILLLALGLLAGTAGTVCLLRFLTLLTPVLCMLMLGITLLVTIVAAAITIIDSRGKRKRRQVI